MTRDQYKTEEEREHEALRHLINFKGKYGYSPSYFDLAQLMGVSKGRVAQIINSLEAKKLIRKDGNKARTIQVQMKV
jgi:DNA-binding MarR family transcriptional regulator